MNLSIPITIRVLRTCACGWALVAYSIGASRVWRWCEIDAG